MASAPAGTCALLIGSYKFKRNRPTVPGKKQGDGNTDSRAKVREKSGIKRATWKLKHGDEEEEEVPQHAWVEGDLDKVEGCLREKLNIEEGDLNRLDYREEKENGDFADGREEVLERIDEFFDRDDKTHFILYFTGHANKHGSWSFARKTEPPTGGPGVGDEVARVRGSLESTSTGSGSRNESRTTLEVAAEVYVESGGAQPPVVDRPTDGGAGADPSLGELSTGNAGPPPTDPSLGEPSSPPTDPSSLEAQTAREERPRRDKKNKFTDLVRYIDVMEKWDRHKVNRPPRKLMLVVDSCYAGQWVLKTNGHEDENPGAGERFETEKNLQRLVRCRNDVFVQAACRGDEVCMVAGDQLGSVFTSAFVYAQTKKSIFSKVVHSFVDHFLVLHFASLVRSHRAVSTPMSSDESPIEDINFFDCHDDMHLKT